MKGKSREKMETRPGRVTKEFFGRTGGGEDVFLFKLEGAGGAYIEALNYGAVWKAAVAPDRDGVPVNVILSYDALAGYESDRYYIGAIVGRCAGRVKGASFSLNGTTYRLQKNDGGNSLHGGFDGYGKRVWDYEVRRGTVEFRLRSPDGDQGYPGNLDITVTYSFDEQNALTIDYLAESDADTPVSLTNHAYFNLAGADSGAAGAMAQNIRIDAREITEIDGEYITTGRLLPVGDTPFDFRTDFPVGVRINTDDPQMRIAGGYDFNFALDGGGLREAALLACPRSGISLCLLTTCPGVQFYSGNMLGAPFEKRGAVCLEPQDYPNSVNIPHFPSSILKAGQRYSRRAVYRFGNTIDIHLKT